MRSTESQIGQPLAQRTKRFGGTGRAARAVRQTQDLNDYQHGSDLEQVGEISERSVVYRARQCSSQIVIGSTLVGD